MSDEALFKRALMGDSGARASAALPPLPLPPPAAALAALQRCAAPLLNTAQRESLAAAVLASAVPLRTLHARLAARLARASGESWLGALWLARGYLRARHAAFVRVNWSMAVRPHPLASVDPLVRAALLLARLAALRCAAPWAGGTLPGWRDMPSQRVRSSPPAPNATISFFFLHATGYPPAMRIYFYFFWLSIIFFGCFLICALRSRCAGRSGPTCLA